MRPFVRTSPSAAPVRSHHLAAFLLFCLAACQAETTGLGSTDAAPNEPTETPSTHGRRIVLAAQEPGSLRVVFFDPRTETFAPFGAPIPNDGGGGSLMLVAAPELERVFVRSDALTQTDRERFFLGDGTAWRPIGQTRRSRVFTSLDMSLVAVESIESEPSLTKAVEVTDFDGRIIAAHPARPWSEAQHVVRIHPRGLWWIYREKQALWLHPAKGGPLKLAPPDASTQVYRVFDDSLIILNGERLSWVEMNGAPIGVPGFLGIASQMSRRGYQVDQNGRVAFVGDRVVTEIATVPVGTSPDEIRAHDVSGRLLVREESAIVARDRDGNELARYTPPGPTLEPEIQPAERWETSVTVHYAGPFSEGGTPSDTVIVGVQHAALSGDVYEPVEAAYELWRLNDGRTKRLVTWRPNMPPPYLQVAGDFAYFVEADQLVSVDLGTHEVRRIESSMTLRNAFATTNYFAGM